MICHTDTFTDIKHRTDTSFINTNAVRFNYGVFKLLAESLSKTLEVWLNVSKPQSRVSIGV